MFLTIEGAGQLAVLFLALISFVFLGWRQLGWAAATVLFLAPTYLLKINHWPLTVLELFLLTFFLCWLIKKIKEKANFKEIFYRLLSLFGAGYFWALGLIFAGVLISALLSVDWKVGAGIFKAWILEPIIFSLILAEIVKSKKDIKTIIFSLIMGSFLVAITSLIYKFLGQLTFDGRLAAWYLSPNHLAMYLAPGFILAWWVVFTSESKKQQIVFSLAILLSGLVLYFTFSYGAWLGILGAIAVALFLAFKASLLKKRKIIIISLLVFIIFLAIGCWQGESEKMINLLKFDRSSWQSRLMVWQATGKILESHWLFGIGPGLFQKHYLAVQSFFSVPYLEWAVPQPHNLFLAWWLQGGLLGLIGFLVLLVTYFKDTVLAKQKSLEVSLGETSRDKQLLVIFLATAIIYILIHGLTDTAYWKNDLALVFWSIVSLSYTASHWCD